MKALEEFEVAASAFLRMLPGSCVDAGEHSAVYCINAAEGGGFLGQSAGRRERRGWLLRSERSVRSELDSAW